MAQRDGLVLRREVRQPLRERVVERELLLFGELQHRDRRELAGQRADLVHRVLASRDASRGIRVSPAVGE
jgi:hypothetical protein